VPAGSDGDHKTDPRGLFRVPLLGFGAEAGE
jgi:hypothetical protein